ncbi:myoferlin-like isoform X4 [Symsagittifera roscoffensis]|uniref:myoferlin-like isoform X4 n=1 Tax=Symsagittifera roscoffensis TaxID=84072 RepID=UPI00307CB6E2
MSLSLLDGNKRKIEGTISFLVIYKSSGKKGGGGGGGVSSSGDSTGGDSMDTSGYDTDASQGLASDVEELMGEEEAAARKAQMKSKRMGTLSDKPQDMQIRVKIFQARQLPGGDINSVCKVSLGKDQKSTKVKKNSAEPNWNETFFFNVHQSPQELFSQTVEVELFNARVLRSDALIGSYKLDVGAVYDQPQHAYLSKWLLLTDPEDPMSGCKGYVKFTAMVIGAGDEPPKEKESADTDDIEMNLLAPAGVQLQPATFWLKVFRAEDVPQMDTSMFQGIRKILGSNEEKKELVDPYMGFYFAGKKVKTKVITESNHPEWNQELRLGIKFPSMCDKIKINMKDWDQMSKDDTIGTVFIELDKIQDRSTEEQGFLPTLGPTWMNFYGSTREFSDMPDQYESLNEGKGEGCAYRGRVLVELGTTIGELPDKHIADVDNDDLFRLHPFVRRRRYTLFASFMEATMLCEDDDPVEFEISIGNYGNKLDESVPPQPSTTQPTNPVYDGESYYFLPWQDKKPCLSVNCQWEDISFRLEALNMLLKIADTLEENVDKIELAMKANESEQMQAKCVVQALDQIIEHCRLPLPDADVSRGHAVNQLDREQYRMRRKQLTFIADSAFQLRETCTDLEEAVEELKTYLASIRSMCFEPQNSVPDVVIWMISGEKRVAYLRIPAYDVLYSDWEWGRGRHCGTKQTIFLKFPGVDLDEEQRTKISAEVRLRLWLGLESQSPKWHTIHTDADVQVFGETYENQVSLFGNWTTTGLTRPEFSDEHGHYKLQKEKFVAPRGWQWAGDWFISPEASHSFDTDAHHVKFLEDIFENESRNPGGKWGPSPHALTDVRNDPIAVASRDAIQCPEGWEWDEDWRLDLNRAVDDEGWEYCVEATVGNYSPAEKTYHLCRRRRWVRGRSRSDQLTVQSGTVTAQDAGGNFTSNLIRWGSMLSVSNQAGSRKTTEDPATLLAGGGWEYATVFTGKFHDKEKTMDMCRRRRWHRKLNCTKVGSPCLFLIDVNSDIAKPIEYTKKQQAIETGKALAKSIWHRPSGSGEGDDSDSDAGEGAAKVSSAGVKKKIMRITPRMFLVFKEARKYQLRVYIYQARGLLSADDDSFSDPFARVVFMNRSQSTEVIHKSICPTWDQTLLFDHVTIYDNPDDIERNPPNICIELFDYDRFGSPEFMGRAVVQPLVKLNPANTRVARLAWHELHRLSPNDNCGELLASFELFAYEGGDLPFLPPMKSQEEGGLYSVPAGIRPVLQRTAIEVLCWGVRNMKKYQLSAVNSPSIEFECGGHLLHSDVIRSVAKNPNFSQPVLFLDVLLPKEELYTPPMNIRCRDNRQFGRKPMVGMCSIKSLQAFKCEAPPLPSAGSEGDDDADGGVERLKQEVMLTIEREKKSKEKEKDKEAPSSFTSTLPFGRKKKKKMLTTDEGETVLDDATIAAETENIDWWCKFYCSEGLPEKGGIYSQMGWDLMKVYDCELEKVQGFAEFNDFVQSFPLERGKCMEEDDDVDIAGEFKGSFRIYPLPHDPEAPVPPRIFNSLPENAPTEVVLRVYVVRAVDLQPQDDGGAADPYIVIKCGKTKIVDQENYKANTLCPVFGNVFEITTMVPINKDLVVQLWDYDMLSADDLIGETRIDLENRYLTHFRATCGLPQSYCIDGINKWRDCETPVEILKRVCRERNLSEPLFVSDDTLCMRGGTPSTSPLATPSHVATTVETKGEEGSQEQSPQQIYRLQEFEKDVMVNLHWGPAQERLALHVLRLLDLAPEHVETRPLFNDIQPGIEQGRLQMWVDMFPAEFGAPPGDPIDISPRVPKEYELRVVIWNTKEVILQDTSITGEEMVDIYLKGWLDGMEDSKQSTDIHYRSLDGEGNFNWRFVFRFDYLPQEKVIVVNEKEHFWSLDKTETHLPARLCVQIWDNDLFSSDDYIGQISLPLENMPAPSKTDRTCKPYREFNPKTGEFKTREQQKMSLMSAKRTRGWWPCMTEDTEAGILAGKIEMELEVLPIYEAEDKPAGKARDEPNANPHLDPPNRPESSFLWFMSPWKTLKYIIWKNYKWKIIGALFLIIFIAFFALMIYTLPGAMVNKLVGVGA